MEKTMKEKINTLDDAAAMNILNTIAQSRMHSGDYETILSTEIQEILKDSFSIDSTRKKSSEGDLARQALLLLSEDGVFNTPLSTLMDGPKENQFAVDPLTTAALITAALVILQTHVKFERDKDGKMSLSVEKKPTKDTILKPFIEKLLSLIP
jgi:hypothetical protein